MVYGEEYVQFARRNRCSVCGDEGVQFTEKNTFSLRGETDVMFAEITYSVSSQRKSSIACLVENGIGCPFKYCSKMM